MIVDPEIIRSVAVTNCQKFARSDFVTKVIPSIEKALFAVNGRVHARQRRMIGPAFNSSNLRGFLDVFKENAEKLLRVIKQLYIYKKKTSFSKGNLVYWGQQEEPVILISICYYACLAHIEVANVHVDSLKMNGMHRTQSDCTHLCRPVITRNLIVCTGPSIDSHGNLCKRHTNNGARVF